MSASDFRTAAARALWSDNDPASPSYNTCISSSAPTAAASIRDLEERCGPSVIATTFAPDSLCNLRAASRAYSSYGLIVHFDIEPSSTDPPAMLILAVVSGTCLIRTATFMRSPYVASAAVLSIQRNQASLVKA